MKARFMTELEVKLLEEFGGIWTLLEPLVYYSDMLGKLVVAPAGFNTDFASGPSLFWLSLARDQGRKAATIHDWLYTTQAFSREQADDVFHEALLASGYGRLTAGVYWSAVRAFGGSHWKADNLPQPTWVEDLISGA